MKTKIDYILHRAVLVLLLAVASWSVGFCIPLMNSEFVGSNSKAILGLAILLLPTLVVLWAFRLELRSQHIHKRESGWSALGLYIMTIVYCGYRLSIPFDSPWGLSFILVALLALISTIALLTRPFFHRRPKQQKESEQVGAGDAEEAV